MESKKEFFTDKISNNSIYLTIVVCAVILFIPIGDMSMSIVKAIFFGCTLGIIYSTMEIVKNNNLKKKPMLSFEGETFTYFKGSGKATAIPIKEIKEFEKRNRMLIVEQQNGRKLNIMGNKFSGKKLDEVENWLKDFNTKNWVEENTIEATK